MFQEGNHRTPRDKIKVSGFMVKFDASLRPFEVEAPKWVFPKERFVTYESGDEVWCRYFNIGHQQPARIVDGEIVLRQDLPMEQMEHPRLVRNFESCVIETLRDVDYLLACSAVEYIGRKVRSFLLKELQDVT